MDIITNVNLHKKNKNKKNKEKKGGVFRLLFFQTFVLIYFYNKQTLKCRPRSKINKLKVNK